MDTIKQSERPLIDMVISRVRDDSPEAQVRCVYNALRAFRICNEETFKSPVFTLWVSKHAATIKAVLGDKESDDES